MPMFEDEDFSTDGAFDIDDVAAAYLKSQTEDGQEDLSEEDNQETSEAEETDESQAEEDAAEEDDGEESEEDSEDDEESEEDSEDDEEADDKADRKVAEDDAVVEVKVDGESQTFKVSDLKRLAGQEAALTKRSQEVADVRKRMDQQVEATGAILKRQYDQAVEKAQRYKDVDLYAASRELDPDDFEALRKDVEDAQAQVKFFEEEIDGFLKQTRETYHKQLAAQAKEAIPVLKENIPDWSEETYNAIREYGMSQGFSEDTVNQMVDPTAIIVLNKARLYDQGKKAAVEKTKKVKKVDKTKLRKSNSKQRDGKNPSAKRAMKEAMESGDIDSLTAAYIAANQE